MCFSDPEWFHCVLRLPIGRREPKVIYLLIEMENCVHAGTLQAVLNLFLTVNKVWILL